jgi:UDP-N-acetylmuramyl pentapeptide synthase
VAAEEGTAVEAVPEGGSVILNADDGRVLAMAARTKARVLTFGFSPKADLKARAIETESAMGTYFTRFEIWSTGGRSLPVTLSGAIGDGNVYAALAAAAVAKALGVSDELIPYGLAEYQPPPGRLRLLAGRGGAFIIDDTYNSSPRAAELALKTLAGLSAGQTGRKMAVLGDMLELGEMTEESHRRVGTAAAASGLDLLVCVGPKSRTLCQEAVKNGMHEKSVLHFGSAEEAGHFLHDKITSGDRLLIKGSRGMRMEKAVKILMADPSLY